MALSIEYYKFYNAPVSTISEHDGLPDTVTDHLMIRER